MDKVLVIGFDGLTFDVINPMIREGKLPTFKKFIEEGSYGTLRSIIPLTSANCWTSLTTGKNPGKTGIFDFFKIAKNSYDITLNCSKDIKAKRVWELIKERSIVINVPLSYPSNDKKNIILTDMFTPDDQPYARKDIMDDIEKNIGKYLIDVTHFKTKNNEELYQKVNEVTENRARVCKYLMDNYEWKLCFVVFTSPDRFQHKFWNDKEKLKMYYSKLDSILENLTKNFNGYTLVVSDHGFCGRKGIFYMNSWLNKVNLLKSKTTGDSSSVFANWNEVGKINKSAVQNVLRFTKIDKNKLRSVFRYLKLTKLQKFIPKKLKNYLPEYSLVIDWSKTKAFTRMANDININLEGRDPKGIVKQEEYDKIRDEIIEKLKNDFKNNGKPIIDFIHKREDIYNGPYLDKMPDILYYPYAYKNNVNFSKNLIINEKGDDGIHDLIGIFICKGKGIKKGKDLGKNSIMDVCPTILHLFGEKIPADTDGKIIENAFEKGSKLARKAKFEDKTQLEMDRIKSIVKNI